VRLTPPLDCGLLPGLKRAELLASGEIAEAVITRGDLDHADEVWLINSVRGWLRCEFDGRQA
jgi:para-aminobenzoate synthetase/4-amino-4-deoxychorismate lyase